MIEEIEVWKEIPDTDGRYQVSDLGRIKSMPFMKKGNKSSYMTSEKIIKTGYDKDGYVLFVYSIESVRFTKKVHRLVAEAFVPNPDNLPIVDHDNDIKDDNRAVNLKWATHRRNTVKHYEKGYSKDKYHSNFPGVTFNNKNEKWSSRISMLGTRIFLGYFEKEEDAKDAYEKAFNKYHSNEEHYDEVVTHLDVKERRKYLLN